MMKAKIGKEIVVRVRNEIGVLAQLTKIIADKGVNVLAVCGWVEGIDGVIRIVTEDNLRASDALRQNHYNPREMDCVLTEAAHKPGMLRHVAEKLAQGGVDVHHIYASAGLSEKNCLIVFSCASNDKAVVLLNA
jgi:hypothetical protein